MTGIIEQFNQYIKELELLRSQNEALTTLFTKLIDVINLAIKDKQNDDDILCSEIEHIKQNCVSFGDSVVFHWVREIILPYCNQILDERNVCSHKIIKFIHLCQSAYNPDLVNANALAPPVVSMLESIFENKAADLVAYFHKTPFTTLVLQLQSSGRFDRTHLDIHLRHMHDKLTAKAHELTIARHSLVFPLQYEQVPIERTDGKFHFPHQHPRGRASSSGHSSGQHSRHKISIPPRQTESAPVSPVKNQSHSPTSSEVGKTKRLFRSSPSQLEDRVGRLPGTIDCLAEEATALKQADETALFPIMKPLILSKKVTVGVALHSDEDKVKKEKEEDAEIALRLRNLALDPHPKKLAAIKL